MDLGEALRGVQLKAYVHSQGRDQPAQQHLQAVRRELKALVPSGMRVLTSGAGQSLPVVPWIAVLDSNVTTTAQEGLYVVYLYRQDLSRVYLSMNQGATQHQRNAGEAGLTGVAQDRAALAELRAETALMRKYLSEEALVGLTEVIELGAPRNRFLPCGYEEGNVAAIQYDPAQLPDEDALQADLNRFLALYASCVEIKNEIRTTEQGLIKTTAGSGKAKPRFKPKPPAFRPKTPAEYHARMKAYLQDRMPRHEALLNDFAKQARAAGLVPANNAHPCDLTVTGQGNHWLVEVKTVGANAEHAVRDAIGQLFSYRHFCYRENGRSDPSLVALFSEPVGEALVDLIESLGIEAIWRQGAEWCGRTSGGARSLLAAATTSAAPNA
ncbi:MrcB family domain-containing protein [Micromonospora sp. WMMD736]|uniref:MrcB family domain-containing protein n=1 Tax=Micromonospora sp. WMMD736 TaxID=3404112 RepID=UPI003B943DA4